MPVNIDGGAGVTFPDGVQQTNGVTNTGGEPRYYAARAWVNFTGAGVIRASSNVTSVTRNSTGTYTINFASSMPDTNYVVVGSAQRAGSSFNDGMLVPDQTLFTVSSARVYCVSGAGALADGNMYVVVFR